MSPSPNLAADVERRIAAMEALEPVVLEARRKGYSFYRIDGGRDVVVRFPAGRTLPNADVVRCLANREALLDLLAAKEFLAQELFGLESDQPAAAGGDPAGTPGGNSKGGAPATAPGSTGPGAARAPSINQMRAAEGLPPIPWGEVPPGTVRAPSTPYHTAECLVGMEPCPPRPGTGEGTPSIISATLTAPRVVTGVSCLVTGEAGYRFFPLKEPLEVQAGQTVVVGPDGAGGYMASLCPACDPGRPCLDHGGAPEQDPPPMPGWMKATCWTLLACLLLWVGALLLVAPPEVPR